MVSLYLHDCYPDNLEPDAQTAFYNLVMSLRDLMTENPGDYRVLIDKMPSEYRVVGKLLLSEMVKVLSDKDMRTFAFGLFNKYPIEDYYSAEDVFAVELPDYKFNGKDALNVYVAGVSGFLPMSLPMQGYKVDELILQDEGRRSHTVHNYYGLNKAIVKLFLPNDDKALNYVERIKNLIEGKVKLSDEFEEDYGASGEVAQRLIYSAFESACNAGLLNPCKADDYRMKKFYVKDGKHVYELRALAEVGYRVIVNTVDGVLHVALFYTKAEANTHKQQKAKAERGWNIINRMNAR